MSSTTAASPVPPVALPAGPLPRASRILVVTARPGQESADLGGLLYAFRRSGASLALLCLTRGEASPLNSTWCRRLEAQPSRMSPAGGEFQMLAVRGPMRPWCCQ